MKLSDIQWSDPERPIPYRPGSAPHVWLRTARLDKMHPDGVHRAGKTINVYWLPDSNEYGISGNSTRMSVLAFAALIKDYWCQVHYNEWGEF